MILNNNIEINFSLKYKTHKILFLTLNNKLKHFNFFIINFLKTKH